MANSPLMRRFKDRAKSLKSRALDELLASEGRADALGAAVRRVQDGRRVLDDSGMRIAGVLGLATAPDLERVERKVGKTRKRLLSILERIDDL